MTSNHTAAATLVDFLSIATPSGASSTAWSKETILKEKKIIRSEKLQNESSPNFQNYCPEFCPEFYSEFSPNFLRSFHASFRGNGENPRHFSMQNSQANSKKKSPQVFWRAGTQKILSALIKEIHVFLLNSWGNPLELVLNRAFPHQLVGKRPEILTK